MLIAPEITYTSVRPEYRPFFLSEVFEPEKQCLFIVETEAHMRHLAQGLKATLPKVPCLPFPSWDCLPYDRSPPRVHLTAERTKTLIDLAEKPQESVIVIAPVKSFIQRLPPKTSFLNRQLTLHTGEEVTVQNIIDHLIKNQFLRVETVREPGEFSTRGSLMDIFPSPLEAPVRIDFFGDTIDSIHPFDPLTQRRSKKVLETVSITSMGDVLVGSKERDRFKNAYDQLFGFPNKSDSLFHAVVEGVLPKGIEHWSPLFYETMSTLLDFLDSPTLYMDLACQQYALDSLKEIHDCYQTRLKYQNDACVYNPLPPNFLYQTEEGLKKNLTSQKLVAVTSLSPPVQDKTVDLQTKALPFKINKTSLEPLKKFLQETKKKRTYICASTKEALETLSKHLNNQGVHSFISYGSWEKAQNMPKGFIGLVELSLDTGFTTPLFTFITERDILGDRLRKLPKKRKRSDLFIAEASSIKQGDYLVHDQHGIGQYQELCPMEINGAAHDCLMLLYEGGDKLFVPVENLEILSRYGGDLSGAKLDKLGHTAWQKRKAKAKKNLLEMAEKLLEIAASRKFHAASPISLHTGSYDEFCSRFPHTETEDQLQAIQEIMEDLQKGIAMDRLLCGDVGFGKTEVALRAAFLMVTSGKQVAIITPTTLLCRQHYKTFKDRFEDFGIKVASLSRLISPSKAKIIKSQLEEGKIDIIVGTHALLSSSVGFKKLGLIVVDEEQHFGVKQKEKLKDLKADVHILTMTATPIPRTLQMAMGGVRDMSLIATPPTDRLAVRTFVMPFDGVVVREALLREHHRGGQSFYVCPRIKDLSEVYKKLNSLVPELKMVTAHGQMAPKDLEDVMEAFYSGHHDILLATNIIESGIDVPNANTLMVHRPDLFGLSQLYQLRGRIGRSKIRAYAYFTLPNGQILSKNAHKRLDVMQTLDTLGAGFQLASYDLDIRGAGNILGKQQSGHIKEIGVDLYQQMLQDAIAEIKARQNKVVEKPTLSWSPQLNLGIPVFIPETYVSDLSVRLDLYNRLSHLESEEDVKPFVEELIDRFGPPPQEVENLMGVITLKHLCKKTYVSKIDVGRKGFSLSFYENTFPAPEALIHYIQKFPLRISLKPNQSLIYRDQFNATEDILKGLEETLHELIQLLGNENNDSP